MNEGTIRPLHAGSRTEQFLLFLSALLCAAGTGNAQLGSQEITLVKGWNSVWLEVEPLDDDGRVAPPNEAFQTGANSSIEVIASPKPRAGLAEFFGDDPSAESGTFNRDGWEQWQRNDQGDVSDLVRTTGNRGYLIFAGTGAGDPETIPITIEGRVSFFRPSWTPDRYNLIGFGVDPGHSPGLTFETFFGASDGRHPYDETSATGKKIYRLLDTGIWEPAPKSTVVGDGIAYWIFSNGPSDYMGPVAVDFDLATTGALDFGGAGDAVPVGEGVDALELDLEEVVLTNLSSGVAQPEIELVVADPGQGELELHLVSPASDRSGYDRVGRIDSVAGDGDSADLERSIASQTTGILTIGARRAWLSGEVGRTNLYRLRTGGGTEVWLPVSASKNDLQLPVDLLPETDAGRVAGLWVGEVIVDAVTSVVEDGAPVRPAAGPAPVRILLHSDGAGGVRLLSQVTVMQTKTADPEIEPQPVLVVDAAQIPFFEGIEERNGKRVGVRLEAVAYDMPRRFDGISQAALLADEAFPELEDEGGIPGFLNAQRSRPSSLEENYFSSWPLEGAIGSGKTVATAASRPLNLDPFHRSNPFRHAFQRDLARGPNIVRSIEIVFDADPRPAGRLSGDFRETILGLSKSELELTGRVELRRVSAVANLEGVSAGE